MASLGEELLQMLSEEELTTVAEALGIESKKERETQAQALVNLALTAGVELFHDPEGKAYATVPINGHKETWPITARGSGPFRNWLRRLFYEKHGKPPGSQALQDAVGVLEAKAQFDGPEYPVFTRLAEKDGRIYLDLGNETWEAVEVGPDGWRVVSYPPVKFRRAKGMLPLPHPEPGGSIEELRRFVNVPDEASWRLLVAWLIAALRPKGPYPVLLLQGEQGSAKSTTARVLRSLVDPNTAPLRTVPKEERDLMIAAANSWVLSFDNLSGIPAWLSDSICRLATGGGFSTRTLYENDEETIFSACRPVVANGIDELASRHDLLDRAIILNLPPIPEEERIDEATFWAEFEEARPRILGALLNAISAGLRNFEQVWLDKMPRMADFAKWVVACEEALPWPAGGFLEAYMGNKAEAVELALEADVVAAAVKSLIEEQGAWEGTASELLVCLEAQVSEQAKRNRAWPNSARTLSNRLRRAATFLRATGIEVEFSRTPGSGSKRLIRLTQRLKNENNVATVASVAVNPEALETSSLRDATQMRRKNGDATQTSQLASHLEALGIKQCDDSDNSDAKNLPYSSEWETIEL